DRTRLTGRLFSFAGRRVFWRGGPVSAPQPGVVVAIRVAPKWPTSAIALGAAKNIAFSRSATVESRKRGARKKAWHWPCAASRFQNEAAAVY
ncbi:MAG: hypothetical protein ABI846_15790, partial [Rudaea sp.]